MRSAYTDGVIRVNATGATTGELPFVEVTNWQQAVQQKKAELRKKSQATFRRGGRG